MSVQEAAVSLLQRVLFYVGIDWAAETHAVCVLDATGRIRAQFTIGHTAAGFADLLRRLARLTGDPAEVAVGIERPDGRLVDVLLEAGYRSSRSARTRSRRGGTEKCCPARSPTPVTPR